MTMPIYNKSSKYFDSQNQLVNLTVTVLTTRVRKKGTKKVLHLSFPPEQSWNRNKESEENLAWRQEEDLRLKRKGLQQFFMPLLSRGESCSFSTPEPNSHLIWRVYSSDRITLPLVTEDNMNQPKGMKWLLHEQAPLKIKKSELQPLPPPGTHWSVKIELTDFNRIRAASLKFSDNLKFLKKIK